MLFYEQPSDPWLPFDFKLLEAYQILQDEICPHCGHPTWLCRSTSNALGFKVRSTTCYAEKAMKDYENNQRPSSEREKDNKVRARWGEHSYTVPFVPENLDTELPTRRDFYQELNATVE